MPHSPAPSAPTPTRPEDATKSTISQEFTAGITVLVASIAHLSTTSFLHSTAALTVNPLAEHPALHNFQSFRQ
jgi:hypothetical protein